MPTLTIFSSVSGGAQNYQATNAYTGGSQVELAESIPDSSTDLEVSFPLDVSAVKAIAIVADQDITIEINDGSAPDNTIDLEAGVPYIYPQAPSEVGSWVDTSDAAMSTDWTSLFVTNASGADTTLYISAVLDPTP